MLFSSHCSCFARCNTTYYRFLYIIHAVFRFVLPCSTIRAFRDCSSLLLNGSASGRRPAAGDRQQSFSGKPKQKESSASLVMFFFSCMILHFRFVLLLAVASLGVSCVV